MGDPDVLRVGGGGALPQQRTEEADCFLCGAHSG